MLGRRNQGQRQLFYEFRLDEAVPDDHLVRQIALFVDLSWDSASQRSPSPIGEIRRLPHR